MALCVFHASTGNPAWLSGVRQGDVAPAKKGGEDEPGVQAQDKGEVGVGEVEGGDEVEGLGVWEVGEEGGGQLGKGLGASLAATPSTGSGSASAPDRTLSFRPLFASSFHLQCTDAHTRTVVSSGYMIIAPSWSRERGSCNPCFRGGAHRGGW